MAEPQSLEGRANGGKGSRPHPLEVENDRGEGLQSPPSRRPAGLPLVGCHLPCQPSSLRSCSLHRCASRGWRACIFCQREVVKRDCTGLSQRVAVGGAQFLSSRGDCGLPGGLQGLSQTPEEQQSWVGPRSWWPAGCWSAGSHPARPQSPLLVASQRQMLVGHSSSSWRQ